MSGLRIEEHAKKQADDCSGGTKRKLSYAMAMLGDPRIVLLDEPSCGMDPQSKRFVWDTILASFKEFHIFSLSATLTQIGTSVPRPQKSGQGRGNSGIGAPFYHTIL